MAKKKETEVVDFNIQIGQKLKQLRNIYGISQKTLADYLGITQQNIVRYETGSVSIPFSAIVKICSFFNISNINYLIAKPGSFEELIYSINIHDFINLKGLSCLNSKATGIADVSLHALSEIYSSNNKALISEINRDLLEYITDDVSKLDDFRLKNFLFEKIKTNPDKFNSIIDKYYLIYCALNKNKEA